MSNLFEATTAPLNQLQAQTAQLFQPTQAKASLAATSEANFMANPQDEMDSAVVRNILQRFLQDFEYVTLDYTPSGSVDHPEMQLENHSHIHFRMCNEDREALAKKDPSLALINTYLSRQIDRGSFIMKKLGFDVDDFYVHPESGELRFDAKVAPEKIPEGMSERHIVEEAVDQLQKACSQARANRKNAAAVS